MTNTGNDDLNMRSEPLEQSDATITLSTAAPAHVTQLNDVTLRDGHQSLLAGRMTQADLLAIAKHLAKAGFARLEVWGGTTFDVPIRFKNENPFTNMKELRDVIHASAAEAGIAAPKLSMLLRGRNLVGYRPYSPELIGEFVKQAAESGVQVFRIFDALNDIENVKDAVAQAAELRKTNADIEIEGTLCFTKIDAEDVAAHPELAGVHSTAAYVAYAKKLKDLGATSICIKDMAGMMEPADVAPLVSALKNEVGLPVVLHTHSAMGLSDATIAEAVRCGVDQVDTAAEALSGGCGQSASTDIVVGGGNALLAPVNASAIEEANREIRARRGAYSGFEIPYMKGLEERLRKSQVPGGMVTTFWEQIDTQFASLYKSKNLPFGVKERTELLYAILDEVRAVRADAGYVSLVTPSSQYTGSQAVVNVMEFVKDAFARGKKPDAARKAELRYKTLSGDFASMVVEVAERVATRDDQLCAKPSDALLEKARAAAQKKAPLDTRPFSAFEAAARAYTAENADAQTLRENALILALGGDVGEKFLKVQSGQLAVSDHPEFAKFQAALAGSASFAATRAKAPQLVADALQAAEAYVQVKLRHQRVVDAAVLGGDIALAETALIGARSQLAELLKQPAALSSEEKKIFANEMAAYLDMRGRALGVGTREIKMPWALAHAKPDKHWLDQVTGEQPAVAIAR